MHSCLMVNSEIKDLVQKLRKVCANVDHSRSAGTIVAKDGDVEVFRAILKNHGGPWICTFKDGQNIKWENLKGGID